MDSDSRQLVTVFPLQALTRDGGVVDAQRGGHIGESRIREHLRAVEPSFVLVDIGHPLRWFDHDDRFEIWKTELRPRLVPPDQPRFFLSDYAGEYCYVATEWLRNDVVCCISFEKHH